MKGIIKYTREYLFNIGGYGYYKYNLTDMPKRRFLNKVVDVAYKVDLAYYKKRKQHLRFLTLIIEKYVKIIYSAVVPLDVRIKLRLGPRLTELKKVIR